MHVTDNGIVYIENDVIKFRCTVINAWNTLPVDSVDFSSFTAFKRTVFIMLLSLCLFPGYYRRHS